MTQLKCAANIEVTESLLDTNENKSLLLALFSCYPHIIQTVYPHYHNYHTRSFPWHIPGTVPSINRRGYTSSFSHSLTDTSLFNSSGRVGSLSSSSTSLQIDKKSMVVNRISAFKGAGLAISLVPPRQSRWHLTVDQNPAWRGAGHCQSPAMLLELNLNVVCFLIRIVPTEP